MEFASGKITTIVGTSGCGKTVLLKHLNALYLPDAGEVFVDGVDITKLRQKDLYEVRSKFGVLFQGAALLDSFNVFDNVAFPLREKTSMTESDIKKKVDERLEQVGLGKMGSKLPAELSGGMRKRAGLARALINDPAIVLFDEPTTGLDPVLATSIHQLIARTQNEFGYTGIIVSHTIPQVFEISDYIAMLAGGHYRGHVTAGGVLRIGESSGTAIHPWENRRTDPSTLGVATVNHTRTEISVGIFVLIGMACLAYLAIRLGKLELFGAHGYVLFADFASVAGLKPGDPVEIAGVKVGRVEGMTLAEDKARLTLRLNDGVKLQEDVIASVRARGLIGDKFVLVSPGASDKIIPAGGKIRETDSPPDIADLIGKVVGGDLTSKGEKKENKDEPSK